MLRILADEDFNHRIVRGLRRKQRDLDIVRVQENCSFDGEWEGQVIYLPLK